MNGNEETPEKEEKSRVAGLISWRLNQLVTRLLSRQHDHIARIDFVAQRGLQARPFLTVGLYSTCEQKCRPQDARSIARCRRDT